MKALILWLVLLAPLMAAPRPNIVFIMADDLGYGDLSSYGAPDLRSPAVDSLMAAGVRFNQFYANCPVCSPSRAAFLTGLYPDMGGVPGVVRTEQENSNANWGKLREDVPLLPEVLKSAGYHTALIGKWHLGLEKPDRPVDRGFDLFHGFLGDMMDDYYNHRRHGNNYMRRNEEVIEPEGHATDLFTDWAIDYLKGRAAEPDKPFFLFLSYNAPHTPIQPPDDWVAKAKEREPDITDRRAKLVALIEHMDAGIGRVTDALKENGQWENTLVVFTSDNGGQDDVGARNAPFNGAKQDMLEGGIRVPTCVVWPGMIEPGRVEDDHVSLGMDFFPTLADVAGAEFDGEIDGRSFAPLLRGEAFDDPPRDLYWVRLEGNPRYGGIAYHAVRRGPWKLLRNHGFEPYRLYHLGRDPGEENPVPKEEEPKVYRELWQALESRIYKAGTIPWQRE